MIPIANIGDILGQEYVGVHARIITQAEADGRWCAVVPGLLKVLAYGQTREQAVRKAGILALRVLAERFSEAD